MELEALFPVVSAQEDCGCCQTEGDNPSGCASRSAIFTARELKVLGEIREDQTRAQEIKQRLLCTTADPSGKEIRRQAMDALEQLRQRRRELEVERLAAAEERMRMLGHA